MAWFFCGIVVGASVTCLAWWRDSKAQSVGLEKADVLNRLFTDHNASDCSKTEQIPAVTCPRQVGPRYVNPIARSRTDCKDHVIILSSRILPMPIRISGNICSISA